MKRIEKIKAEIERLKSKCPDSEWQLKVAMNKLIDSLEKEEEKSDELTPDDIHLILIAKEEIENENLELMVKSDTSLFEAILERYLLLRNGGVLKCCPKFCTKTHCLDCPSAPTNEEIQMAMEDLSYDMLNDGKE